MKLIILFSFFLCFGAEARRLKRTIPGIEDAMLQLHLHHHHSGTHNSTRHPWHPTDRPVNVTRHPWHPTGYPGNATRHPLHPTGGPHNATRRPWHPTGGPHNVTRHPWHPTGGPHNVTRRPWHPTGGPHNVTRRPWHPTGGPHNVTRHPWHPTGGPHNVTRHPWHPTGHLGNSTRNPWHPTGGPHNVTRHPWHPTGHPGNSTRHPWHPTGGPHNVTRHPWHPTGHPDNSTRHPWHPTGGPHNVTRHPWHPTGHPGNSTRHPWHPTGGPHNVTRHPWHPTGHPGNSTRHPWHPTGGPHNVTRRPWHPTGHPGNSTRHPWHPTGGPHNVTRHPWHPTGHPGNSTRHPWHPTGGPHNVTRRPWHPTGHPGNSTRHPWHPTGGPHNVTRRPWHPTGHPGNSTRHPWHPTGGPINVTHRTSIGESFDVIDGSGICKTWSQYTRQQASVWDKLSKGNQTQLQERVLQLISSGKCLSKKPPRGQCPMNGGKCDSGKTRTESVFMSTQVNYNGSPQRLVVTNGIPNHCYQVEEQHANPNSACENYAAMILPLSLPKPSSTYQEHPMGPVGVSISGAFFYNHKSAEAHCNVAAIQEKPTFDPCDGHADAGCRYHYHKAPVCIKGWNSCKFMGFIHDGYPVYGGCTVNLVNGDRVEMKSSYKQLAGTSGCDVSNYRFVPDRAGAVLDKANGYYFEQSGVSEDGAQTFAAGTYAYFFTPEFPFIMPGTFADTYKFCYFDPSDL